MDSRAHVMAGADGERIRVEDFGEPGGKPVLVHPGSPGSPRLFRRHAESAARGFGIRLLSYDRPGDWRRDSVRILAACSDPQGWMDRCGAAAPAERPPGGRPGGRSAEGTVG